MLKHIGFQLATRAISDSNKTYYENCKTRRNSINEVFGREEEVKMATVAGVSEHNKTSFVFPASAFVFLVCGGVICVL